MANASAANLALLPDWLSPEYLLDGLTSTVVTVLCLIIFIESSIFPVLPGDSLLFTAGLFVASGAINAPLWLVCTVATIAALVGNVLGCALGWKLGPVIFGRPNSRFFKQEYVDQTHAFLEKHGPKAVVLARFVPFVRTFITWVAGIGKMSPRKYFTYTVIGGVLWAAGLIVLGSLLGGVAFIRGNIEAMAMVIVVFSVIPIVVEYAKSRRARSDRNAGDESSALGQDPVAPSVSRHSLPAHAATIPAGPAQQAHDGPSALRYRPTTCAADRCWWSTGQ